MRWLCKNCGYIEDANLYGFDEIIILNGSCGSGKSSISKDEFLIFRNKLMEYSENDSIIVIY